MIIFSLSFPAEKSAISKNESVLDRLRNLGYVDWIPIEEVFENNVGFFENKFVGEMNKTVNGRFYSETRGGVERFEEGYLIAISNKVIAIVVDRTGNILWEFHNPDIQNGKRAVFYRMSQVENNAIK